MKIVTSEAVFKGHPDKICDQISDAILDACLSKDKNSRVAVETLIKNKLVVIAGEVITKAEVDSRKIARDVLKDLGYEDLDDFEFIVEISQQSPDIALGVDKDGAGDQGLMYGYACKETKILMPLPIVLARKIAVKMDSVATHHSDLFGNDGKCQVSILYDDNDKPVKATSIVVSRQTKEKADRFEYASVILHDCIQRVVPFWLIKKDTKILINPTGEFVKDGAYADSGLTGRKIICDTYGGVGRHGGGAFSGKDISKVDRLGAYYARYVAKNIVAAGLARKCEVSIAYAIGIKNPVAVNIDTFGTGMVPDYAVKNAVLKLFHFSVDGMRNEIITEDIVYRWLAEYGHVGRTDITVPWERIDSAHKLKFYVLKRDGKSRLSYSKVL